jgi:hypothetical protein
MPRLFLTGPFNSGKSTFLDAIQPLVQNPVRNAGQLSTTFAYRNDFRAAVAEGMVPVTMVDETRHIFKENGKGGSQHPLYAIATEGYSKKGAPVKYQEKDMNVVYSCYQLAIFASRGNQSLPEDVIQRAITMPFSMKPEGMKLLSLDDPTVSSHGEQCGVFLRTAIQSAEKQLRIIARDTDWYEKEGFDNRAADIWIPLFTIAELAGGQWPSQVQAAYAELGARNSRNLPTTFQLQVDVLSFINMTGCEPTHIPCREMVDYLSELGRQCYTWDSVPFTIRKFGLELRTAGVEGRAVHGKRYYSVSDTWLKNADRLANPVVIDPEDPDNEWSALDEFFEQG